MIIIINNNNNGYWTRNGRKNNKFVMDSWFGRVFFKSFIYIRVWGCLWVGVYVCVCVFIWLTELNWIELNGFFVCPQIQLTVDHFYMMMMMLMWWDVVADLVSIIIIFIIVNWPMNDSGFSFRNPCVFPSVYVSVWVCVCMCIYIYI